METVDYGETDLRSIIEGDRRYNDDENYGAHGFSQQELVGEELVDIEEEPEDIEFDEILDEE